MARYRVEIKRKAAKELGELDPALGRRILILIEALSSEPRPRNCRKLFESESCYRLRAGPYRVLYEIDDEAKTVTISAVGHRREVYR